MNAQKKHSWWDVAWVVIPVVIGIIVSLFVAGTSITTDYQKLLRLVGFLVGWAIGFSCQLAALERRFDRVVDVVGESLQLPALLFNDGPVFGVLRKIIRKS